MVFLLDRYKWRMKAEVELQKKCIDHIFSFFETYLMEKHGLSESYLIGLIMNKLLDVNLVCDKDDSGDTLLHRASACGNAKVVCILLNSPGIKMNVKNKKGLTAAEVICTRVCGSLDWGKIIPEKKYKHTKYIVDTQEYKRVNGELAIVEREYYSCQDPNYGLYNEIKEIFDNVASVVCDEPVKKKHKK